MLTSSLLHRQWLYSMGKKELQKQVSAFKKKTAQVQSLQRGLPSIFLGPKEAAAVDTSAVYEAGCKGLQDLLQYDERFRAFESSLFHSSSVNLQRELKTKEENSAIDVEINSILGLLSLWAGEPSAHLVLEYLVRRYRVHEFNMDALLRAFLVVHDTKIFAKIVHLCRLEDTPWVFLVGVKESGVPPPRSLLVHQAMKSPWILDTVCDITSRILSLLGIKKSSPKNNVSSVEMETGFRALAFTTAVIVEVANKSVFREDMLRNICLLVIEGLKSKIRSQHSSLQKKLLADWKVSSCVVISQISVRTQFGDSIIKAFSKALGVAIAMVADDANMSDVLDTLLTTASILAQGGQLLVDQNLLNVLFSEAGWFFQYVETTETNNQSLLTLIGTSLFNAAAKLFGAHGEEVVPAEDESSSTMDVPSMVVQFLKRGWVDERDIAELLASMLRSVAEKKLDTDKKTTAEGIVRAMSDHYPHIFNNVVKATLADNTKAKAVTKFLSAVFSEFGKSSNNSTQNGDSVFLNLSSAIKELRLHALSTLESSSDVVGPVAASGPTANQSGIVDAIMRCLADADYDVASQAWNTNIVSIVFAVAGPVRLFECVQGAWQSWSQEASLGSKSALSVLHRLMSSIEDTCISTLLEDAATSAAANAWVLSSTTSSISLHEHTESKTATKVVNAARSLLSVFLKKHHITEKKSKATKGAESSVDVVSLLVTAIADDHHHALLPVVERAVALVDSDYTLRGLAVFLVRMATVLQQHKHLSSLHTLLAKALAPLMSRYLAQTTVADAVSAATYSSFVQVLLPTMVSLASGTYTSFDASLRNSLQPLTAEHRMEAVFLQLLASQGVSGEMLHAALETVDRNDVLVLMARFLQSPVDAHFPVDETAVRTISLCSVHAILVSSVNVGTACIPTLLHLLYLASSATSSLRTLAAQCFKSFAQLVASNSTRSLPLNKELSVNVAEISTLINAIIAQLDLVATDGDTISSVVYETLSKASSTLGTLSEAIFMAATSISAAHDRYASFLIKLLPTTVFVEKNWKGIVAFLSQAAVGGRVTGEHEGFLTALLTWIANGFKTLPADKQASFITWLCETIKSAKSLDATFPRLLLTIVVPLLATGSLAPSAFEELLRCLFAVQSNTTGSKDVVRAILSMEVDPTLGMALLHDALHTTEDIDAMLRIRKNSIVDEDAADESRMQVDDEDDEKANAAAAGGADADEGVRDYASKPVSISAKLRSMVAVAEMVVPMVLATSAFVQQHASALFRALFNLLDKLCQPGCVSVINLEFYKTMICELLLQLLNRAAAEQCLATLFTAATTTTAAAADAKTPSKSSKGKKKADASVPTAAAATAATVAAYTLALARKDIGSILHCLSSVRSSNIQGSALGVLRHIIGNFADAMPALIELLGDFLSHTSAHGTHLLTRGKILVSLLSIIVPTGDNEASKSVSLATRDIVFHVLQALPGMPSNHRAALLKALAKLEDHREWMCLLIVQNLLQHTLVRYESKVAETANVTVESISLSRAAQRRAQRVLLTSDSEEFFHMAEQFLLDQSSASIIKSVIKILDASRSLTLFCVGNDTSSSTKVDTDDVARLLQHFNTLRREGEAASAATATAATDGAAQRGQAASMAVLQLEFINEILLSPQFHRQLAADMLGNRVTHNDMMEVAECALQICVECESLRQARQRSTQRGILLRLENESHQLSAKLLSEIFADLSLNVLGNMQVLLDGPSFLSMIQELLDHDVPAIRQRAIVFLKDRLQSLLSEKRMSQIEHGLYLDLCGRLRTIIKTNLTKLFAEKGDQPSSSSSANAALSLPYAQSALLAIDVLVLKLGKTPQWQTVVMDILGEYLSYFDAVYVLVGLRSSSGHYQQKALESRKFLGSLMLSCSSLCMALHAAALPVFPALMEKTLHVFVSEASQWRDDTVRTMNLDSDRRAHVLFLRSLISATSIMFSSLPKFSHPYIATILPLLLEVSTGFAASSGEEAVVVVDMAGMDDDAEACLTVIGNELPPRLALPAVCSCLRESVALGGDALHRYVALLQVIVTKADRATCVNNMATLLPAVLALMKALKTTTPHFHQQSFTDAQDGIGELVVEICLKLTENELKTFIVRLSDWKSSGNQSGGSGGGSHTKEKETAVVSEEDEEDKFYRYVHFYATIKALLDRFQTLFFSSMALLWTDMMSDLDAHAKFVKRLLEKTKANSDGEDGGSKKRKRSVDLYALLTGSNKLVLSLLFDAVGHVMSITKALCTFTGATFFDEKRYETIYPKILTFIPMWQAFDGDESYFGFAREHLITALCELCLNINRDLLWKPLNHQVLLFTRNASPLVRIVAVDLLHELFEKVGADYLAVLPECLSYISELLEDDNSEVVKHTRQAIAVIEELSGESLDSYLR